MNFNTQKPYFVNESDVVLRISPKDVVNKNAKNHLILGDYVKYLGSENGDWVFVRSRGNNGWLKKKLAYRKKIVRN